MRAVACVATWHGEVSLQDLLRSKNAGLTWLDRA